jgi:catechol 2,3-dioxygenase-like lactoylglutathione lyase family enzyme
MLSEIHPKLPMRDKAATRNFYVNQLGFAELGSADFDGYLMVKKDNIEIHFFRFADLDPKENYGQVYIRTNDIAAAFDFAKKQGVKCNELSHKPWGQMEFSVWDGDNNLLTFGENIF